MGNLCIKTENSYDSPKIIKLPPYFEDKNIYVKRFLKKNNLCKHGKSYCPICLNKIK